MVVRYGCPRECERKKLYTRGKRDCEKTKENKKKRYLYCLNSILDMEIIGIRKTLIRKEIKNVEKET